MANDFSDIFILGDQNKVRFVAVTPFTEWSILLGIFFLPILG